MRAGMRVTSLYDATPDALFLFFLRVPIFRQFTGERTHR